MPTDRTDKRAEPFTDLEKGCRGDEFIFGNTGYTESDMADIGTNTSDIFDAEARILGLENRVAALENQQSSTAFTLDAQSTNFLASVPDIEVSIESAVAITIDITAAEVNIAPNDIDLEQGTVPTDATMVWQCNFNSSFCESSADDPFISNSNCAESILFSLEDPLGGSNPAAKFFQWGNIACSIEGNGENKHRCQRFLDKDGDEYRFLPHIDYFIGYRLYMPSSFPASYYSSTSTRMIHWGWLASATPGELQIQIGGSGSTPRYYFKNRYRNSSGSTITANVWSVNMAKNQWHDIIIQMRREFSATGILKLWVNGNLEVNGTNIITASPPSVDPDPYCKFGIYWGEEDRPDDVTIYMDDLKVATGSGGYSLVDPS